MSAGAPTTSNLRTLAQLLERLGDIEPDRVRLQPPPGTATVADVITVDEQENLACELIENTLVEKRMGLRESLLAMALGAILREFVKQHRLGFVTGPDSTLQLFPNLVRIPDVAFISWQSADGRIPTEPVPLLAPDLAVEILSRGNTVREMERKRAEYFTAGVRLVWIIDPPTRTATVFTGPDAATELTECDALDGSDVLPGFTLPLAKLFAELDDSSNDVER